MIGSAQRCRLESAGTGEDSDTAAGSGRRHNHSPTISMIALPPAAIHNRGAVANISPAHSSMVIDAAHLARRLTAPLRCQSRIIGPKMRCAHSHACNRVEPRAAAHAASKTNGVVGKPGSTMPITPSANATHASVR